MNTMKKQDIVDSRNKNKKGIKITCDTCITRHLYDNFEKWTSGNAFIDGLLQRCQLELTLTPEKLVEWVPYENFENVEYKTKGGYGSIYTAIWINGWISDWDDANKQFIRIGSKKVALKLLNNSSNPNEEFFEEAC
ncbi:42936_t:CDS:1 [Gigaspora margarita]|uniref:42936_t:CDS:1 n=1 Tax=Gigaspora margarita TaxID=4874 RepID=A0ABM8VX16_GIGMA|nr:42936_t:CDS:1 [Gigaspora margarita]